jgi:hypothetical protein
VVLGRLRAETCRAKLVKMLMRLDHFVDQLEVDRRALRDDLECSSVVELDHRDNLYVFRHWDTALVLTDGHRDAEIVDEIVDPFDYRGRLYDCLDQA